MRETANLLRSAATDVATDATQAVKADKADKADRADKPVSPGGPTDQRPDVRAADDPPHPDPAAAELPFADTTAEATHVTEATATTGATTTSEAAGVTEASEASGATEADPPARPPGPAFHSAAPPTADRHPDLEQDGEAPAQ
jgi:hypothetical protein